MNDRKQHVIETAHKLFIDQGYQATSIQDILEESGISKGTFYNYFPSKSELLIAIFKALHKGLEKELNDLLIGQDLSDLSIFIKQIEMQMELNKKNKLFTLFEEVLVSNDTDLKQFIKKAKLIQLTWVYNRLIDIFGETKEPYLLDCAVMFLGILHHNIHYHVMAYGEGAKINQVIHYSVDRLVNMVDEVSQSKQQLLKPEMIELWLPGCIKNWSGVKEELLKSITGLKEVINHHCSGDEEAKSLQLLEFIQEELLQSISPRKFVIDCALHSLKSFQLPICVNELQKLEGLIFKYLNIIENK